MIAVREERSFWQMRDPAIGVVNVTDTPEACAAAARPDVDPRYTNYCVQCLAAYIEEGLTNTYVIPIAPPEADSAMHAQQKRSPWASVRDRLASGFEAEQPRARMEGRVVRIAAIIYLSLPLVAGCRSAGAGAELQETAAQTEGSLTFQLEAWADNWFAAYLGTELLVEDSVWITTERSFNAERVKFRADYPLHLNFVLRDFMENDSGLDHIGRGNQQMGP